MKALCGENGIRTRGTVAGTTVFETAALSHSATSGQMLSQKGASLQNPLQGLYHTIGAATAEDPRHATIYTYVQ